MSTQSAAAGADARARVLARYGRLVEHDEDLRRSAPSRAARERLRAEGRSSFRSFALACELYADRPCLGEVAPRAGEGRAGEAAPPRAGSELTFGQLWGRVQSFASGLRRGGLGEPGATIGIAGVGGVDWVVADLACLYLGAVSVPLPSTANADELRALVAETGLSCIVSSREQLDAVVAAGAAVDSVRAILGMGGATQDRTEPSPTDLLSMAEVEQSGRGAAPVAPAEAGGAEALRTLIYTSGSTGSPKGALFPERIWALYWGRPWDASFDDLAYVSLNYMPLNHMAGRLEIVRSLTSGGLTYFRSHPGFLGVSDLTTLFEDIRAARPTMLFLVPRLASAIYQRFQTEVMRRAAEGSDAAEGDVIAGMRGLLGDRLSLLTIGSAPTAPEVVSFLERCFDVPVVDGYGSTEAGGIALDGRVIRDNVTAYEIVDVPELGYRTSDRPYPRGELRVKTRRMVPGYYRNPEATRTLFDEAGYLRTGDIVEQRDAEQIAWIDRRKNVLKLSQGEFVGTARLEEVYAAGSPFVRQIYLHGSSLWSYLLAVIVPEGTTDRVLLRSEIDRVAAREGLRPYEIPRDFLVETEPFTVESGLLTESGKHARAKMRLRYGERLERLHADIERRQSEALSAVGPSSGGSPAEKVARLFAGTLGMSDREVLGSDQSFQRLGGDSLAAAQIVTRIKEATGVDLPVSLVLDPTSSVSLVVRAVEERLAGAGALDGKRASFATVHGGSGSVVSAADVTAGRFFPDREILAAGSAPPPPGPPVVALTGANGFLGRFLLLELLERAAASRGKVVAIVRARTDEAARERLTASFLGADPSLPVRFAALSAAPGRLEVLAGDLIEPRFGIASGRWDGLAAEVSAVVHAGALVNHAFSYAELFEPNVLGTVEAIRLALPRRATLGFVSTAGVVAGLDRSDPIREDEDAAALWQQRPADGGYAVGYATSKWADEVLLRDLEARSGVPVSVFRCTMILPSRAFAGQINTGDLLTRLLYSVVATGLAPRSFYADGGAPRAHRHHFDGLPVDTVARAIASVALGHQRGFATYHVADGHWDDGVSLDTYVDWVQRAGYDVRRVDDHRAWFAAFRERLEALSPAEQQHSTLPILKQWERPLTGDLALDNRRLRRRLSELGEPAELPAVDESSLRRYLDDLAGAGLLPTRRPGTAHDRFTAGASTR